jgi:hypothetical protein
VKSAPLLGLPWSSVELARADHVGWFGPHALDQASHDRALAEVSAALEGVERGVLPDLPTLRAAIARLGLRAAPPASAQVVPRAADVAGTDELVRVTLDYEPDAGELALEAVLGPWASRLDVRRPLHRRAWIAAVAVGAFADHPGTDHPPVRSWVLDRKRNRLDAFRQRLLATSNTPPAPWRLEVQVGQGWTVTPLLPMHADWVPSGPVDLSEAGAVDGELAPGALLWARLVPTTTGHVARAALVLPRVPPREVLVGALVQVGLASSTSGRALKLEDLLRLCGHRLIRASHVWHAVSGT